MRTFIAVEIGQDVRGKAAALIQRLAATEAKVKWVEPENLHFTMKFLGEIDPREIPAVCDSLSKSVTGLVSFEIEALGAGAFPTPERPRTLWLGVGEGSEQMVALHGAIENGLAELGFRTEGRRFRPHLTLGRVRNSPLGIRELGDLVQANAGFPAGRTIVDAVVLFSSELDRRGAHYEPLGHAELKG